MLSKCSWETELSTQYSVLSHGNADLEGHTQSGLRSQQLPPACVRRCVIIEAWACLGFGYTPSGQRSPGVYATSQLARSKPFPPCIPSGDKPLSRPECNSMRIRGNDASSPARRGRQWRFPIELSSNQPRHQIQMVRSQATGLATNSAWNHRRSSQLTRTRTRTRRTSSISGPFHEYIAIQPSDHSTCPRAKPARIVMAGQLASRHSPHPNRTGPARMCTATRLMSSRRAPASNDTRTIDGRSKQRIEPGREPGPRLRNLEKPANI